MELERALLSLSKVSRNDVCVSVYEDCSPNQVEIERICETYSKKLSIDLVFMPSPENLGYDKNLWRALSDESEAEYVMLLSDDDFIDPKHVDQFVDMLYASKPDVVISPYIAETLYREGSHYSGDYSIDVLYDSILFSGLTFKVSKTSLREDEVRFLSNSIYIQVFLVCKHWSENSFYFKNPLVIAGSDGENYFGKSEVSSHMDTLKDRTDLMSNLYYQKYLQRVAYRCLGDFYPSLIENYTANYSKRLVSHFFRVRMGGSYLSFVRATFELSKINLTYNKIYLLFILALLLLPKSFVRFLHNLLISKYRVSGG